ncbi:hypothetical protein [Xenorhabdus sp. BG5]|uniref:hypothetical protein n=1 Tax=Xenorhabdus sp. BG5 TaxID=2782014 RepID=UPI001880E0E7|nr:hypothetical protein [Xenorhabdus sp. BG5]MBE8595853.1 hypothetical protein [Xenorhabdus sp. BG5]
MDWENIVFSGIFSGLVGGILWTIQKKGRMSKNVSIVIFIIATIGWNVFDFKVLRSTKGGIIDGTDLVIEKEDEPIFLTIKNKDPKLYDEFKQKILALQKEGKSHDVIYGEVVNKLISLVNKRILFALDKDIVAHAQLVIKQMEFLQQVSAEKCLRFVFPEMNKNVYDLLEISKSFPKELYNQRIKADRELIISSYSEQQYQSSDKDDVLALQDLETIMVDMVHKYGEDITLLDSYQSVTTNKEKSCELLIDINKRFIELPPERAARLYRYLMSQSQ